MRMVLALGGMVLLAGCFGTAAAGKRIGTRPETWDNGDELVGISSFYAHRGTYGVQMAPEANDTLPMPAYCLAYRADALHRGDTCELADNIPTNDYRVWKWLGPWSASAKWTGGLSGSSYGDPWLNVVAFDPAGQPVAHWNGTFIAGASRMTQ